MSQCEIYQLITDDWQTRAVLFEKFKITYGRSMTHKNFNACLSKLSCFVERKYENKKAWFRRRMKRGYTR